MGLSELWLANETELEYKSINQIVSIAGDGKLRDDSLTSIEIRKYLRIIPSSLLKNYISHCLDESFDNSGLILQDIINEVGNRLDFNVENGRYRGIKGKNGFDGLWTTIDNKKIIVEVKTTDAYRIDLNTLAGYKKSLLVESTLAENDVAILIIVGRKDTGDLESQVRGSRFAWDIRIISIDSLVKLLDIKEKVDDPRTLQRIHEILFPKEYTKIDGIVDLIFSTTEEVIEIKTLEEESELIDEEEGGTIKDSKKKFTPVSFRNACIERYKKIIKINLVKKSYALFETENKNTGVICLTSKEYNKKGRIGYWFAFHPHQKDYLEIYKDKDILFALGSENIMIKVPYEILNKNIENCNRTTLEDGRFYWHIHIHLIKDKYIWMLKKDIESIDLTPYIL